MRKIVPFLLSIIIFCNFGCYSVRKKFIRKKKSTKEAPVYVAFKDYPQRPTRKAYINYYLFVRGWLDELVGALEKGVSFKRKKRSINEAIMNLEQIISFYNTEGREQVYPFYEDLLDIKKQIEKNPNMSSMKTRSLIRKIELFKRRFEKNFNYTDAEKWMS